jgi:hypothetical protein
MTKHGATKLSVNVWAGESYPPMFDFPCGCTPSDLILSSPIMLEMYRRGVIAHAELERQARGAKRLAESHGHIAFHARNAALEVDYWHTLYASQINS